MQFTHVFYLCMHTHTHVIKRVEVGGQHEGLVFSFYHVGSETEARGEQLHLRPLPFPPKPRIEDGTQGFLNMLGRGSTNTYI